jgi:AraC-like DNA-binding protein
MKEHARAASRSNVNGGRTSRADPRLASTPFRPAEAASDDGPHAESLRRLARLLAAHAPYDGSFTLRIPTLHVVRRSKPYPQMVRATVTPALCVVAQGAKIVMLGREVYSYDACHMCAYAVDLPVAGQIVRASHSKPFLALKLELDPYKIAELALKVYPHGIPNPKDNRGVLVGRATTAIVDAAARLVELMAEPFDVELLAPLAIDEILIRLLRSAIGSRIAQIGLKESGVQRVAKAVSWVRANFAQPMAVEALAELAHMSSSSFHQHFKAVTSMSPLQYQKVLRLHEARRLMLSRGMDAGSAGEEVGYLSASQFSREYARLFGSAPARDVARLRQDGVARTRLLPNEEE